MRIRLQRLNLLVSGFLDFAEFQALEMNPMTMKDWIEALDGQIIRGRDRYKCAYPFFLSRGLSDSFFAAFCRGCAGSGHRG